MLGMVANQMAMLMRADAPVVGNGFSPAVQGDELVRLHNRPFLPRRARAAPAGGAGGRGGGGGRRGGDRDAFGAEGEDEEAGDGEQEEEEEEAPTFHYEPCHLFEAERARERAESGYGGALGELQPAERCFACRMVMGTLPARVATDGTRKLWESLLETEACAVDRVAAALRVHEVFSAFREEVNRQCLEGEERLEDWTPATIKEHITVHMAPMSGTITFMEVGLKRLLERMFADACQRLVEDVAEDSSGQPRWKFDYRAINTMLRVVQALLNCMRSRPVLGAYGGVSSSEMERMRLRGGRSRRRRPRNPEGDPAGPSPSYSQGRGATASVPTDAGAYGHEQGGSGAGGRRRRREEPHADMDHDRPTQRARMSEPRHSPGVGGHGGHGSSLDASSTTLLQQVAGILYPDM